MIVTVNCPSCSIQHQIDLEDSPPIECNCGLELDVYDADTEAGYEVFIVQEDDLPLR